MLGNRYLNDGEVAIQLSNNQLFSIKEYKGWLKEHTSELEGYACECGSETDFDILAEKDRYGIPLRTVICRKCGMIMTNPRMNQTAYDYFYKNYFGKIYRGDSGSESDESIATRFCDRGIYGEKIFSFIEKEKDYDYNTVLEIGCAAGGILKTFQNHGKAVLGIDLDDTYLNYGRKQGLNLITGHSSILVGKKKYDLIVLSHVLEHFLDLESELKVIADLLSPNGLLYIEVPGIRDVEWGYKYDILRMIQNAHVRIFSLETLKNTMNKYGFSLSVGDECIHSIFKYNGEKKTITENYFSEEMYHMYKAENYYLKANTKKY